MPSSELKITMPVVVRLAGTNVEEGRKIIDQSGLTVISAETLADAAQKAVAAAKNALTRESASMAIFINENTPILIQGFTGRIGTFHAQEMIDYGTNVIGGVTPGKGGTTHLGRPVFNTVKGAVEEAGAEASIVFVPPPFAADAIMEAADAGIKYCVCITDGIPAQDMIRVKRYMRRYKKEQRMILTGPNCAGTISPGKAMLGIMPGHIYLPGRVGIVGRSGTLGYEAAEQLKSLGLGVSTSVGIGGDPINGSSFRDVLEHFENDPDTDAVLMIGEIGGPQEAEAGECVRDHMQEAGRSPTSPVFRRRRAAAWATRAPSFRRSANRRQRRSRS